MTKVKKPCYSSAINVWYFDSSMWQWFSQITEIAYIESCWSIIYSSTNLMTQNIFGYELLAHFELKLNKISLTFLKTTKRKSSRCS